jgi:hypothetical protein
MPLRLVTGIADTGKEKSGFGAGIRNTKRQNGVQGGKTLPM